MKEETKQWVEQAEIDLTTAKHSLSSKDYYAASFWCQQAVEKALKALCIEKTNSFPKIHDLVRLGKLAGINEALLKNCERLAFVYIDTRYPTFTQDKYTQEESEEDIKTAGGY